MIPLLDPRDARRPTAIALGSFDGLHAGHRQVIAAITHEPGSGDRRPSAGPHGHGDDPDAAAEPVPTVVSFWPHPREVLHGETRLRLDLPGEKLELLEPLGIRQLVLVPFSLALAALSPEAFVEQVLVGQLGARRVAVGTDFRFGAGRSGDVDGLRRLGARHGIAVEVVPVLEVEGQRMSSSRIRNALAAGEIATATRLLQRPYRFSGRVVRGRGLGRQLGWPTANLQVDGRKFLPLEGVYAAWVWLAQAPAGVEPSPGGAAPGLVGDRHGPGHAAAAGGAIGPIRALPAVMNLGPQPTIDPLAPSAVEVHLLDHSLELEGAWLTVEPVSLLRRQQRFAGLAELSERIGRDADQAGQLLLTSPPAGPPPQPGPGPLAPDPAPSL